MGNEIEIQGIKKRMETLQLKLNALKDALILETDAADKFKLGQEIEGLEQQLLLEKKQLTQLKSATKITSSNNFRRFSPHHQYTCDRTIQDEDFLQYYYQEADNTKKLHFFFVHGGDLQKHQGLYKRFVHKLAGTDLDYKANYRASGITVKDFDAVAFPKYTEKDALKIGICRELMKALAIEDHQMEKVMEKNLAFALQESPLLNKLTAKDKVCFFVSIPERRWNLDLTPDITHWFITHFCQDNLTQTAPDFYFFFSVEYDEDNKKIKQELSQALKEAEFTLALPELTMVTKDDVLDWFTTYEVFWNKKSAQKKAFKKHFADEANEMYMEDVQDILKTIINEINNSEKNDPRN